MKILFVHLGRENIGIEYLSSVLKNAGHETFAAVDIGLFGQNDNIFHIPRLERMFSLTGSIRERFKSIAPDLVCISAYTSTLKWGFALAEEFKRIRDVPIVMGGVHITLAPESAMLCSAIDYGIRGEAESVIAEFAECIAHGQSPEHLPGLIFRRQGDTVVNGCAPLISDLDSIPFPDKTLFDNALVFQDDYMVATSRGCPHHCTYCSEHAIRKQYGNSGYWRVRSVDNLMQELNVMMARYHFTEVFFCSPMFPGDKDWVTDFSHRYRTEIGVPFWCMTHVNHVDREYARLMRDAGCRFIEFGVQSVNQALRKNTLGRPESNARISQALQDCDAEQMPFDIGHIFYLPGETQDDYTDAVRFYARFRMLHRIKVFNLTLFPGTRILDICEEQHLIDAGMRAAIDRGESGDYFHIAALHSPVPEWKTRACGYLLRFLPFMPRKLLLWSMASDRRLKSVSRIPKVAARLFELIYLLRIRDIRLRVYLRLYWKHFRLLVSGRRRS